MSDATATYMELSLKSCPPSFIVPLLQLLNGNNESWGWDLGVPTNEGLQNSVMDEHILFLVGSQGERIKCSQEFSYDCCFLIDVCTCMRLCNILLQVRQQWPHYHNGCYDYTVATKCHASVSQTSDCFMMHYFWLSFSLTGIGPSSCAASSSWWQWLGCPPHPPGQPAPELCQWQSVCQFSQHQHCRETATTIMMCHSSLEILVTPPHK